MHTDYLNQINFLLLNINNI